MFNTIILSASIVKKCTKKAFVLGTKALHYILYYFFSFTYNRKQNLQNRASDNIQFGNLTFLRFLFH